MYKTRYEIDDILDKIREDLLGYLKKPTEAITEESLLSYLKKPSEIISKEPLDFIMISEAEYLTLKDKKYNVIYCCGDTNKLYLGDTLIENYEPIIDHAEVKDNTIVFTTVNGETISTEIEDQ
jgi:hypothetical protein